MAVTINAFMERDHDFTFHEETKRLLIQRMEFHLNEDIVFPNPENPKKFISEQKKVFMNVPSSAFHFMHDFMGEFITMYTLFPDALFIFNTSEYNDPLYEFSTTLPFLKRLVQDKNVTHNFISNNEHEFLFANNFYIIERPTDAHNVSRKILDFLSDYIKDKDVKPFRKVYISRRNMNMHQRVYNDLVDNGRISRTRDLRIDKEIELENFFRSLGYEIMAPEDFETLEDQINFFYEVKTVVSLTSGGLTNSMFMQDGGNVIELVTPIIAQMYYGEDTEKPRIEYEEGHHHYYSAIAFNKRHLYIAIENYTTKIKDFMHKVDSNNVIKYIIENV